MREIEGLIKLAKCYMPSNGTEGMLFMAQFCDNCYKEKNCTILTKGLCGEQPKQWVYDVDNNPTCTSFNSGRPKRKKKVIKNENQTNLF